MTFLILSIFLLSPATLAEAEECQWSTVGNDIYYYSGYVGIGTTSPDANLHIEGNLGAARFKTGGAGVNRLILSNSDDTEIARMASNGTDAVFSGGAGARLLLQSNYTDRLIIDTIGNVGIGTMTPDTKLDVSGKIKAGLDLGSVSNLSDFGISGAPNADFLDTLSGEGTTYIQRSGIGFITGYGVSSPVVYMYDAGLYGNSFTIGKLPHSGDPAEDITPLMTVLYDGNVGIGTTSPSVKLAVNGTIRAKEIKVETTGWPDFVFEDNYNPMSLSELENSIRKNKHLPGIPSASQVAENGINVGEMQAKLLQKIEELTLYMIDLKKESDLTRRENESFKKRISLLENTSSR
jgi:hypothetical protein